MASSHPTSQLSEDGELSSDVDKTSEAESFVSNSTSTSRRVRGGDSCQIESATGMGERDKSSRSSGKQKRKSKRYDELSSRMGNLENMLQQFLVSQNSKNDTPDHDRVQNRSASRPCDKSVRGLFDSSDNDYDSEDNVSLHANGQISPENRDSAVSCEQKDSTDLNNNVNVSENVKKGLFEMFGEDAIVKKTEKKSGIVLDKSQIEVIENSYRCKQPNYLSSFAEDNYDSFPVDSESEQILAVPTLDSLVEVAMKKKHGPRASFSKGKELYSQPAKMIEKISYKGQQAARLGLVIQSYVQQGLGNLLQTFDSENFDIDNAKTMVKDIFAMTTKGLDQIGRAGAFHHIVRRACCMKDTGLHEQSDKWDYYNLPLSSDGVFGKELHSLLKDKKEERKQVDDLIPDNNRKRKFTGPMAESNKRQMTNRSYDKASANHNVYSSSNLSDFRIPKLSRPADHKPKPRGRGGYGSGNYGARKQQYGSRPKPVAKTDEK